MTGQAPGADPSSTATPPTASQAQTSAHGHAGAFFPLALGAVGVVFGDIGTSPLYAFRQALSETFKTAPDGTLIQGVRPDAVFGVSSLALSALILGVTG